MSTQVFDNHGVVVPLGRELGRGGEGAVYEINGDPKRVAKIYHQAVPVPKGRKLQMMASLTTPDVLAVAAWPLSTLYRSPGGPVVGCVQPRASGREVHELYGPAQRANKFPKADWRFLTHVAMNCAAAFSSIHSRGHVIGDVNSKNVWATERATVSLVDCDSFQIISGSERFLCEVGVDGFTPPELQGSSFRNVQRTPNHDCFGLAILIFHLLFMGRHPFIGRFSGSGDMPVELAIKEYRFVFGTNAARVLMSPPPFVPSMREVSPEIRAMFEQAFGPESHLPASRPTAARWHSALMAFEKQLRKCPNDAGHTYYTGSSACPWCEVLRAGGPSFFISVTIAQGAARVFDVDAKEIEAMVARIGQLSTPLRIPTAASNVAVVGSPLSEEATYATQTAKLVRRIGVGSVVATVASGGTFLVLPATIAFALLIIAVLLSIVFWSWFGMLKVTSPYGREIKLRFARRRIATGVLTQQRSQFDQCVRSFDASTQEASAEVASLRQELASLKPAYEQERRDLDRNRRANQLKDFLGSRYLQGANIPRIPKTVIASLVSYGIESADDIERSAVLQVPGVGPARADALVSWRSNLEQQFRFEPGKGVSQADLTNLIVKFERQRQRLKQQIGSRLETMTTLRVTSESELISLHQLVSQASQSLAQAEADCRVSI